jgi:2'-5' RNA ligase
MIRAFLAVELDEGLRTGLAQIQEEVKRRLRLEEFKSVRIAWVQPGSIHLTVKFLGDIEERLVDPLREAVSSLTQSRSAIQVSIERLGAFPHLQQPRVLWAGPSEVWNQGEDCERLAALHQSIEEAWMSLGFDPDDRPLSPHLTLARVKGGERRVGQALLKSGVMDQSLSLGFMVGSLALMKSELRPTGSVYTKLWEVAVSNR